MKVVLGLLVFVSMQAARADIPPPPGTVDKAEVTGQAADILAGAIGGYNTDFPDEIDSISLKNPINGSDREYKSGAVLVKDGDRQKAIVACAMGYKVVKCALYRKYK